MDINNLHAFIEVADRKSFSRSAESLNLSQPAVSKRIAALELELSTKLFDRVGRSVYLTEAGRVLLPTARQIRVELSRIEDAIINLGDEVSGMLRIGVNEQIDAHNLPALLKKFLETYPKADIQLRSTPLQHTLKSVEDGEVELVLSSVTGDQKLSPKLQATEIWSEELAIVVAKEHPLVAESVVSDELLAWYPAILPLQESTIRCAIEKRLRSKDLSVVVAAEVPDIEMMKSLASIGLGWTCLPKSQIDDSLTVLTLEGMQLRSSVALVTYRERSLSRVAQAFLDTVPILQMLGYQSSAAA